MSFALHTQLILGKVTRFTGPVLSSHRQFSSAQGQEKVMLGPERSLLVKKRQERVG